MEDNGESLDKFDVLLDASDPDFYAQLRDALGLKDGEALVVTTPQFDRTDGRVVTYYPKTEREYSALKLFSEGVLKELGCGIWDKENGKTHWLYPHEWYSYIPKGLEITDISGKTEKFEPGVTDDDKRFGCLAYGFLQDNN